MGIEYIVLKNYPVPNTECPLCSAKPFTPFMRGLVVSYWRKLLGISCCAVICSTCKQIVCYEKPKVGDMAEYIGVEFGRLRQYESKPKVATLEDERMNDLLCQFLEKEIEWCESNRGKTANQNSDFEDGFIAGLRQAILFAERT